MATFYVIFDTNVIISGLQNKKEITPPQKLLNLIGEQTIIPVYSEEILDEYKLVLNRPEFSFNKKLIGDFINQIKTLGLKINANRLNIDFKNSEDLKFYEVLMDTKDKDSKLVTGNIKHFPIKSNIVTPSQLLALIENTK